MTSLIYFSFLFLANTALACSNAVFGVELWGMDAWIISAVSAIVCVPIIAVECARLKGV